MVADVLVGVGAVGDSVVGALPAAEVFLAAEASVVSCMSVSTGWNRWTELCDSIQRNA